MNEINQNQNLNAHYTTAPKVEKPRHVVVEAPENIPTRYVYSAREANKKLEALNNDIFIAVEREAKPEKKRKFLGIF